MALANMSFLNRTHTIMILLNSSILTCVQNKDHVHGTNIKHSLINLTLVCTCTLAFVKTISIYALLQQIQRLFY